MIIVITLAIASIITVWVWDARERAFLDKKYHEINNNSNK
jgi:hypothetical protein